MARVKSPSAHRLAREPTQTIAHFMKTFYRLALGLLWGAFAARPLCAQQIAAANPPVTNEWAIVEKEANSQVWQRTTLEAGPGGNLFPRTHRYVQMESGLNYLSNGQYVAASDQINLTPSGPAAAAATNGQHQVF